MAREIDADRGAVQLQPLAWPAHTVVILCLQGALAFLGKMRLEHVRDAISFDRVRIYERTIFFEW
ncbi:MAG: hypothetical protein ABLQ96_12975, partial [Candidatus Acidiferrum sp.]